MVRLKMMRITSNITHYTSPMITIINRHLVRHRLNHQQIIALAVAVTITTTITITITRTASIFIAQPACVRTIARTSTRMSTC